MVEVDSFQGQKCAASQVTLLSMGLIHLGAILILSDGWMGGPECGMEPKWPPS